ncbi:GNAT family N-acetyltransferase [Hyphomonas sp.]|uniref:GNAT family N-acetyltransferase n=1 Tax=Hyphomonas sp. TaxID=87 RepID=UPI000A563ADA|nr:GNAT family N-acetyltransferase [Hyphomonas sp.]
MSEFRIRRAGGSDAEALSHIGAATFLESYTEIIDGPDIIAHCTRQHSRAVYAAYLADTSAAVWIAEFTATGAPVGYAVNCTPDLPITLQDGDVELKRIYAFSRFHGAGIGQALMLASIDEARARGAPRLLLGTYQDNHRAVAFYKRHGFTLAGTRQFQVGTKLFDDIVMAKAL